MKNNKAIKSTIIITVILLLSVFMLINVLAHSNVSGNHGNGKRGFQQNALTQQGTMPQNKLQKNMKRTCEEWSDCINAVNERSLSLK